MVIQDNEVVTSGLKGFFGKHLSAHLSRSDISQLLNNDVFKFRLNYFLFERHTTIVYVFKPKKESIPILSSNVGPPGSRSNSFVGVFDNTEETEYVVSFDCPFAHAEHIVFFIKSPPFVYSRDESSLSVVVGAITQPILNSLNGLISGVLVPLVDNLISLNMPKILLSPVLDPLFSELLIHFQFLNAVSDMTCAENENTVLLPLPPSLNNSPKELIDMYIDLWYKQISLVLKKNHEIKCPLDEVIFWYNRKKILKSLLRQLNSAQLKSFLINNHINFSKFEMSIEEELVLATKIYGLLKPTREIFEQFNSISIQEVISFIPALFECFYQLWLISHDVYVKGMNINIFKLMKCIALVVIDKCKAFLHCEEIFLFDYIKYDEHNNQYKLKLIDDSIIEKLFLKSGTLIKKFKLVVNICSTIKNVFFDYKSKASTNHGVDGKITTPRRGSVVEEEIKKAKIVKMEKRHILFDWNAINNTQLFKELDMFMDRTMDLFELFKIFKHFTLIDNINFSQIFQNVTKYDDLNTIISQYCRDIRNHTVHCIISITQGTIDRCYDEYYVKHEGRDGEEVRHMSYKEYCDKKLGLYECDPISFNSAFYDMEKNAQVLGTELAELLDGGFSNLYDLTGSIELLMFLQPLQQDPVLLTVARVLNKAFVTICAHIYRQTQMIALSAGVSLVELDDIVIPRLPLPVEPTSSHQGQSEFSELTTVQKLQRYANCRDLINKFREKFNHLNFSALPDDVILSQNTQYKRRSEKSENDKLIELGNILLKPASVYTPFELLLLVNSVVKTCFANSLRFLDGAEAEFAGRIAQTYRDFFSTINEQEDYIEGFLRSSLLILEAPESNEFHLDSEEESVSEAESIEEEELDLDSDIDHLMKSIHDAVDDENDKSELTLNFSLVSNVEDDVRLEIPSIKDSDLIGRHVLVNKDPVINDLIFDCKAVCKLFSISEISDIQVPNIVTRLATFSNVYRRIIFTLSFTMNMYNDTLVHINHVIRALLYGPMERCVSLLEKGLELCWDGVECEQFVNDLRSDIMFLLNRVQSLNSIYVLIPNFFDGLMDQGVLNLSDKTFESLGSFIKYVDGSINTLIESIKAFNVDLTDLLQQAYNQLDISHGEPLWTEFVQSIVDLLTPRLEQLVESELSGLLAFLKREDCIMGDIVLSGCRVETTPNHFKEAEIMFISDQSIDLKHRNLFFIVKNLIDRMLTVPAFINIGRPTADNILLTLDTPRFMEVNRNFSIDLRNHVFSVEKSRDVGNLNDFEGVSKIGHLTLDIFNVVERICGDISSIVGELHVSFDPLLASDQLSSMIEFLPISKYMISEIPLVSDTFPSLPVLDDSAGFLKALQDQLHQVKLLQSDILSLPLKKTSNCVMFDLYPLQNSLLTRISRVTNSVRTLLFEIFTVLSDIVDGEISLYDDQLNSAQKTLNYVMNINTSNSYQSASQYNITTEEDKERSISRTEVFNFFYCLFKFKLNSKFIDICIKLWKNALVIIEGVWPSSTLQLNNVFTKLSIRFRNLLTIRDTILPNVVVLGTKFVEHIELKHDDILEKANTMFNNIQQKAPFTVQRLVIPNLDDQCFSTAFSMIDDFFEQFTTLKAECEELDEMEEVYGEKIVGEVPIASIEDLLNEYRDFWNIYKEANELVIVFRSSLFCNTDLFTFQQKTEKIIDRCDSMMYSQSFLSDWYPTLKSLLDYLPLAKRLEQNSITEYSWQRISNLVNENLSGKREFCNIILWPEVFSDDNAVKKISDIISSAEREEENLEVLNGLTTEYQHCSFHSSKYSVSFPRASWITSVFMANEAEAKQIMRSVEILMAKYRKNRIQKPFNRKSRTRNEIDEISAAIVIQSTWRGYYERKMRSFEPGVKMLMEISRRYRAAVVIQSAWRGYMVRKKMWKKQTNKEHISIDIYSIRSFSLFSKNFTVASADTVMNLLTVDDWGSIASAAEYIGPSMRLRHHMDELQNAVDRETPRLSLKFEDWFKRLADIKRLYAMLFSVCFATEGILNLALRAVMSTSYVPAPEKKLSLSHLYRAFCNVLTLLLTKRSITAACDNEIFEALLEMKGYINRCVDDFVEPFWMYEVERAPLLRFIRAGQLPIIAIAFNRCLDKDIMFDSRIFKLERSTLNFLANRCFSNVLALNIKDNEIVSVVDMNGTKMKLNPPISLLYRFSFSLFINTVDQVLELTVDHIFESAKLQDLSEKTTANDLIAMITKVPALYGRCFISYFVSNVNCTRDKIESLLADLACYVPESHLQCLVPMAIRLCAAEKDLKLELDLDELMSSPRFIPTLPTLPLNILPNLEVHNVMEMLKKHRLLIVHDSKGYFEHLIRALLCLEGVCMVDDSNIDDNEFSLEQMKSNAKYAFENNHVLIVRNIKTLSSAVRCQFLQALEACECQVLVHWPSSRVLEFGSFKRYKLQGRVTKMQLRAHLVILCLQKQLPNAVELSNQLASIIVQLRCVLSNYQVQFPISSALINRMLNGTSNLYRRMLGDEESDIELCEQVAAFVINKLVLLHSIPIETLQLGHTHIGPVIVDLEDVVRPVLNQLSPLYGHIEHCDLPSEYDVFTDRVLNTDDITLPMRPYARLLSSFFDTTDSCVVYATSGHPIAISKVLLKCCMTVGYVMNIKIRRLGNLTPRQHVRLYIQQLEEHLFSMPYVGDLLVLFTVMEIESQLAFAIIDRLKRKFIQLSSVPQISERFSSWRIFTMWFRYIPSSVADTDLYQHAKLSVPHHPSESLGMLFSEFWKPHGKSDQLLSVMCLPSIVLPFFTETYIKVFSIPFDHKRIIDIFYSLICSSQYQSMYAPYHILWCGVEVRTHMLMRIARGFEKFGPMELLWTLYYVLTIPLAEKYRKEFDTVFDKLIAQPFIETFNMPPNNACGAHLKNVYIELVTKESFKQQTQNHLRSTFLRTSFIVRPKVKSRLQHDQNMTRSKTAWSVFESIACIPIEDMPPLLLSGNIPLNDMVNYLMDRNKTHIEVYIIRVSPFTTPEDIVSALLAPFVRLNDQISPKRRRGFNLYYFKDFHRIPAFCFSMLSELLVDKHVFVERDRKYVHFNRTLFFLEGEFTKPAIFPPNDEFAGLFVPMCGILTLRFSDSLNTSIVGTLAKAWKIGPTDRNYYLLEAAEQTIAYCLSLFRQVFPLSFGREFLSCDWLLLEPYITLIKEHAPNVDMFGSTFVYLIATVLQSWSLKASTTSERKLISQIIDRSIRRFFPADAVLHIKSVSDVLLVPTKIARLLTKQAKSNQTMIDQSIICDGLVAINRVSIFRRRLLRYLVGSFTHVVSLPVVFLRLLLHLCLLIEGSSHVSLVGPASSGKNLLCRIALRLLCDSEMGKLSVMSLKDVLFDQKSTLEFVRAIVIDNRRIMLRISCSDVDTLTHSQKNVLSCVFEELLCKNSSYNTMLRIISDKTVSIHSEIHAQLSTGRLSYHAIDGAFVGQLSKNVQLITTINSQRLLEQEILQMFVSSFTLATTLHVPVWNKEDWVLASSDVILQLNSKYPLHLTSVERDNVCYHMATVFSQLSRNLSRYSNNVVFHDVVEPAIAPDDLAVYIERFTSLNLLLFEYNSRRLHLIKASHKFVQFANKSLELQRNERQTLRKKLDFLSHSVGELISQIADEKLRLQVSNESLDNERKLLLTENDRLAVLQEGFNAENDVYMRHNMHFKELLTKIRDLPVTDHGTIESADYLNLKLMSSPDLSLCLLSKCILEIISSDSVPAEPIDSFFRLKRTITNFPGFVKLLFMFNITEISTSTVITLERESNTLHDLTEHKNSIVRLFYELIAIIPILHSAIQLKNSRSDELNLCLREIEILRARESHGEQKVRASNSRVNRLRLDLLALINEKTIVQQAFDGVNEIYSVLQLVSNGMDEVTAWTTSVASSVVNSSIVTPAISYRETTSITSSVIATTPKVKTSSRTLDTPNTHTFSRSELGLGTPHNVEAPRELSLHTPVPTCAIVAVILTILPNLPGEYHRSVLSLVVDDMVHRKLLPHNAHDLLDATWAQALQLSSPILEIEVPHEMVELDFERLMLLNCDLDEEDKIDLEILRDFQDYLEIEALQCTGPFHSAATLTKSTIALSLLHILHRNRVVVMFDSFDIITMIAHQLYPAVSFISLYDEEFDAKIRDAVLSPSLIVISDISCQSGIPQHLTDFLVDFEEKEISSHPHCTIVLGLIHSTMLSAVALSPLSKYISVNLTFSIEEFERFIVLYITQKLDLKTFKLLGNLSRALYWIDKHCVDLESLLLQTVSELPTELDQLREAVKGDKYKSISKTVADLTFIKKLRSVVDLGITSITRLINDRRRFLAFVLSRLFVCSSMYDQENLKCMVPSAQFCRSIILTFAKRGKLDFLPVPTVTRIEHERSHKISRGRRPSSISHRPNLQLNRSFERTNPSSLSLDNPEVVSLLKHFCSVAFRRLEKLSEVFAFALQLCNYFGYFDKTVLKALSIAESCSNLEDMSASIEDASLQDAIAKIIAFKENHSLEYHSWIHSSNPYTQDIPDLSISSWDKFVIVRLLRPDNVIELYNSIIEECFGFTVIQLLRNPVFDHLESYQHRFVTLSTSNSNRIQDTKSVVINSIESISPSLIGHKFESQCVFIITDQPIPPEIARHCFFADRRFTFFAKHDTSDDLRQVLTKSNVSLQSRISSALDTINQHLQISLDTSFLQHDLGIIPCVVKSYINFINEQKNTLEGINRLVSTAKANDMYPCSELIRRLYNQLSSLQLPTYFSYIFNTHSTTKVVKIIESRLQFGRQLLSVVSTKQRDFSRTPILFYPLLHALLCEKKPRYLLFALKDLSHDECEVLCLFQQAKCVDVVLKLENSTIVALPQPGALSPAPILYIHTTNWIPPKATQLFSHFDQFILPSYVEAMYIVGIVSEDPIVLEL
ncbi:hypothetical protein PCE1_002222 [Barthelona sp. PCE]